jgi:hypothetical protein
MDFSIYLMDKFISIIGDNREVFTSTGNDHKVLLLILEQNTRLERQEKI